ncbi:MAG: hypothetical protein ACRERC_09640 [Candidatus Binatia bacterium]
MNQWRACLTVVSIVVGLLVAPALADPPVPDPKNTLCPTVQCMRSTNVLDNLDGTFDVTFETFNWFNTTDDGGVNRILFFTGNLKSKLCVGSLSPDAQVDVLGATAPPGWTVVQADTEKVEFAAVATANEIPDIGLCDPAVLGGCFGTNTCGNGLGGFVVKLRPNFPTGGICSWTANWRHLDEFGLDNGDEMNFGSVSWTFGSLIEDYSNAEYPPASFAQNNVDYCARQAQKKAGKYAQTRLKQFGKCNDKINAGKTCDTVKRDQKVTDAQGTLEGAIDDFCTDDAVANIAWCGTTLANLKTCLVNQLNAETDDALAVIYGP